VKELSKAGGPLHASGKSVDGYEDCLKGRYFLDRMADEEIYKAIACFKCAAQDRQYHSLAQAGIADAYCQLASVGSVCSSQVVCLARSSAESALRSDSDLPEAHVSAGRVKMMFDWDWNGTREAVNRALALNTNSAPAHTLHASLLCTLGCYDEAVEACRLALSPDPLSFPANLQLAICFYAAHDFKSAIDQCWNILTLTSAFAPAQIVLALSYQQLGMFEEAVVEFQNAKRCAAFQPAATSGLGHLFAAAGFQREAEEAFLELSAQSRNRYVSGYWLAVICTGGKQKSQALSFLEECVDLRDPALLWLNADARFDVLRDDERFQTVLGRVGTRAVMMV
jgi:tetratricopeptide (TPR) repeat protein